MRSRIAAALPLLLILACADSPTAFELPVVLESSGEVAPTTATATTTPAPTTTPEPASFTAEWGRGLMAHVTNHTDSHAWVEVEWALQQPDGSWWTYWRESAVIGPGDTRRFRTDCVLRGLGQVSVRGHGLWHREFQAQSYCF
jgi:hypothetical protein